MATKNNNSELEKSTMESVLSLDDGRWLNPSEDPGSLAEETMNENYKFENIRQPSPPPILAQVQPELLPISPSRVADPRPGPPLSKDGLPSFNSYQDLHIPVKMMADFLRLERENTRKNLETCGVLAGSLRNRVFHITTLIIPKQESTSDSCHALNEEEPFEVHGIFHLSDPGGVSVMRNCQQRGFHPHEEPEDGSPIYEHCSHVYMNPKLMFDVIDLR
ncbi:AMSH-like ubiquitin thioesterase 3 [Olea europaea subsp. europaea]|uniref:AMSH-like ubiquitin thioesterase 3 n=2 Tax=Olea europaea subsp. europaea TaxID=158383 RepID=A0A8S0TN84_OLEEU|nr:AMSH-like ubiquitin thioesterase 3 [Olea europaea subsp. europaea]